MVDAIDSTTADAYDPPIAHTDIERAPMRTQNARRLHPPVDRARDVLVHTDRPVRVAWIRRTFTPRVGNTAVHFHRTFPTDLTGKRRVVTLQVARSAKRGSAQPRRRTRD
jgi:hypothetical protein